MTTPRSDNKVSAAKSSTKAPHDAISLLMSDHRKVEDLFAQYEKARSAGKKADIAKLICDELTVHAKVEEEGFYPQVKEAIDKEGDLVAEAVVEHASLKWLIAQIKSESQESEFYDAKIMVLKEYVSHHVKEEEKEMFPKVKKSRLDIVTMADELMALKDKYTKQLVNN